MRAKRAFDRLSLLVAPRATVSARRRDRAVPVEEVVVDDVVLVAPGDQLVADGMVLSAADLRLDESILTGEWSPFGAPWEMWCVLVLSSWKGPRPIA